MKKLLLWVLISSLAAADCLVMGQRGHAIKRACTLELDLEVAMLNSNRLEANLGRMEDFADAVDLRMIQCEMRAIADGRPTPRGKAPGLPMMMPMVRADRWTNNAGIVVIQIKEVGK